MSEPAFPVMGQDNYQLYGLTKREIFAMAAMQSLIPLGATQVIDDFGPEEVAHEALSYAKALIAALEAK